METNNINLSIDNKTDEGVHKTRILQYIFKKKYVAQLKSNIDISKYIADDFDYDKTQARLIADVYCTNEHLEEEMMATKSEYDAAILFFESYEGITPLVAAMPEFWAYLTHVDLFHYVKKRWPLNKNAIDKDQKEEDEFEAEGMDDSDQDENEIPQDISSGNNTTNKEQKYILNHWFKKKHAVRTTLMDLWWSVYITVDNTPGATDKYRLTKYFFHNQDMRTRRFGPATFFRHKDAAMGILEFMIDHEDLMKNYFEGKVIYIAKYFNMQGGMKELAYLDRNYFYNELKEKIPVMETIKKRSDILNNIAILKV